MIIHFAAGYPHPRRSSRLDSALGLFLLAVVANIAYCAAYIADIFAQASGFRELWQRYRWLLFAIGTTFAAIITHFVAAGIFHPSTTATRNELNSNPDCLCAGAPSLRAICARVGFHGPCL